MGTRQQHRNGPVDFYLKSPHTWATRSSCKKIFVLLSVQKSLRTKVIPKQKQFKQEEDEEGRRLISSSSLWLVFTSSQIMQDTTAGTVRHEFIEKGNFHKHCCSVCSQMSEVERSQPQTSQHLACLHPPLVIQSYEEERLNAFMWGVCLSWWHTKKNPVKLSSSLLKNVNYCEAQMKVRFRELVIWFHLAVKFYNV